MAQIPRMLLVHAHPDDESINNGATMAKYISLGAQVTLITCTSGEEGEVVVDHLSHVASMHEDRLGPIRQAELATAMAELKVTDHRFLGGPSHFRDSGMIGTEPNNRTDNFWRADLLDAATHLVSVIREIKPQVLITYDDFGGYGHPDHIQAHRVAMYAAALAAAPSFRTDLGEAWDIAKIYWNAMPRGVMQAGIDMLKAQGIDNEFTQTNLDELPFVCDDALVTTCIDAREFVSQKIAALAAHVTQIDVTTGWFATMTMAGPEALGFEYYRLVKGAATGSRDDFGRETELFAGLDIAISQSNG